MAPESFERLRKGAGRRLGRPWRHEAEPADVLDVGEPRQVVEPRKQVAERDVVGAKRDDGKREGKEGEEDKAFHCGFRSLKVAGWGPATTGCDDSENTGGFGPSQGVEPPILHFPRFSRICTFPPALHPPPPRAVPPEPNNRKIPLFRLRFHRA